MPPIASAADAPAVPFAAHAPSGFLLFLDLAERFLVLAVAGWLIYRFLPTLDSHPFNLLLLFSEALVVVFIAFRRFGPADNSLRAWGAALTGTFAPLLVLPIGTVLLPVGFGASVMLAGILFSIAAKMFLRRSFGIVAANRGVEIGGPYRLVRHPMYFGYLLTHIGFLSMSFSLWNLIVYIACWFAMLLRIAVEEGVLRQDPQYLDYCGRVRSRLLPGIW
jgi:protein-S-isoprenylcysteine O-methyltransferase Ste14